MDSLEYPSDAGESALGHLTPPGERTGPERTASGTKLGNLLSSLRCFKDRDG